MSEETFYCKYCDSIKQMSELAEDVDDNERVTWSGCIACHQKRRTRS